MAIEEQTGRIVRSISGFYDVVLPTGTVTCQARGILRKEGMTPLTGDMVRVVMQRGKGMIQQVLPRKNSFIRPAVANVDALLIFAANVNPVTEPFLIDRVTAIAGNKGVESILCVNKTDLDEAEELCGIYSHAGFRVIATSAQTGAGIGELRRALQGKLTAFTGNSGVGKSSILNALKPELKLATGEVSQKLGRGRHTTRHVALYSLGGDTLVADTPGFASFDTEFEDGILKEDLQYAFPDFAPFLGHCQFADCTHRKEPGCAVRQAVQAGTIAPSRYESYQRLYEQASLIKPWERPGSKK